ncbi:uncharacterized protein [Eleutherodactylus coqui]|uniref:uncharacterized protein n=3 Tax=Eleutherodactylus coqui TaxID=57060 RepID=UPI0034627489
MPALTAARGLTGLPDVSRKEREKVQGVLRKGMTPVILEEMVPYLSRYPDREKAELLFKGFRDGFHIPPPVHGVPFSLKNLRSALEYPEVVTEKLMKEVRLGRMAGPFEEPPVQDFVVSPLGVVPKKEPNKFRLIHHLSYPRGASVNDGIDPELCSVVYTSFDAALHWVRNYGRGALMAKADIESAFRLLPVTQESVRLLGCFWAGSYFADRCLPMGCSISCAYFEAFSSFLEWVVKDTAAVQSVIHYLDDFLCVGPGGSPVCANLLGTLQWVAKRFGVPLAPEKTEGPTTCLSFLGITIDSEAMECRLPEEKLRNLQEELGAARVAKKITLKGLQSLLGKLNFACRIMPMGRVFSRRLAAATAGIRAPHHFIRLGVSHKADLAVWSAFLEKYNGRSVIMGEVSSNVDWELYTDAAGSAGFGAYFQGRWCAGEWPEQWKQEGLVRNLVLLELFPIVVAITLWGNHFRDRKVRFHCDNMGVVQVINNLSASSPPVVNLLRQLVLEALSLNMWVVAVHVPGVENSIADALSRFQWERFRTLAPGAEKEGRKCPSRIWNVMVVQH